MAEPTTRSGKTHETENFPVASILVRPEHRPPIMAFYDFARAADDIADDPRLSPEEKVRAARLHGGGADRRRREADNAGPRRCAPR